MLDSTSVISYDVFEENYRDAWEIEEYQNIDSNRTGKKIKESIV